VLDEPSIGLHSRDIQRLVKVLLRLRDAGNTILVVEHDPEVIRAADLVVELGPGPGERGGEIVFFGSQKKFRISEKSLTAAYINGTKRVSTTTQSGLTATVGQRAIQIRGAAEHNLKAIDVTLPLDRFVCVTGMSGSGKSTLIEEICHKGIRRLKGKPTETPGQHEQITGHEHIEDIVLVDQSAIGKTTRSNPASYVGALDSIRKAFAETACTDCLERAEHRRRKQQHSRSY